MSDPNKKRVIGKKRRIRRSRAKISGTPERPRLCVFRSLKHIYSQVIDDRRGQTLVAASDGEIDRKLKGMAAAQAVGQVLAKKCLEQKITKVIFDRHGNKYHGQVKALAEGARAGGLQF